MRKFRRVEVTFCDECGEENKGATGETMKCFKCGKDLCAGCKWQFYNMGGEEDNFAQLCGSCMKVLGLIR